MAGPQTYTREDTIELTCHGGPVPLQETLRVVLAAGARHAEPGEFTLRAFLNGRLDLAQAEAVLNVVSARTSEGLRLAIDDLAGDLSRRIRPARDAVVSLLAYLDAAADFPEDEIPPSDVDADLAQAETALAEVVAGSRAGILYRDGAQIALVGRPTSARAVSSTRCCELSARSSPRSPERRATSSPNRSTSAVSRQPCSTPRESPRRPTSSSDSGSSGAAAR